MAAPITNRLPPWVVNSGQQAAWNAANPATQKDWMKHPSWRPQNPNTMATQFSAPAAPAWNLGTGAVPAGYGIQRDPISGRTIRDEFTDAIAEMGRGAVPQAIAGTGVQFSGNPIDFKSYEDWVQAQLAAGIDERHARNPTILSAGVKQMWGLDPNFRDPRWQALNGAPGAGAGEANALAFNARGVSAQTPWFQSPWGAASRSRETPYYMGAYGRRT